MRLLPIIFLLAGFAWQSAAGEDGRPGNIWPDVLQALEITMPYLPGGKEAFEREKATASRDIARISNDREEIARIRQFFTNLGLSHFSLQPRAEDPSSTTEVIDPKSWSEPLGHLPSLPTSFDREMISPRVMKVSFSMFLPNLMADIRESILTHASEDHLLILDLRGNPGGLALMASGLAGLLTDEPFSLGTMTMPDAVIHQRVFPQPGAHLGPVAILIDDQSASTTEILAAGLQERGRAVVIGKTSAGAVLPSFLREVGRGGYVLQYPVADYVTDQGTRLEGKGVQPDIEVPAMPGRDSTAAYLEAVFEAFPSFRD